MSYVYRKRKRLCAHWLLEILSSEKYSVINDEYPHNELWAKSYKTATVQELRKRFNRYTIREIYFAALLLSSNKHIEMIQFNDIAYDAIEITCTFNGEEAYWSEYYLAENSKDFVEDVQRKTTWFIPIASLSISLIALIISLFNACHVKK